MGSRSLALSWSWCDRPWSTLAFRLPFRLRSLSSAFVAFWSFVLISLPCSWSWNWNCTGVACRWKRIISRLLWTKNPTIYTSNSILIRANNSHSSSSARRSRSPHCAGGTDRSCLWLYCWVTGLGPYRTGAIVGVCSLAVVGLIGVTSSAWRRCIEDILGLCFHVLGLCNKLAVPDLEGLCLKLELSLLCSKELLVFQLRLLQFGR